MPLPKCVRVLEEDTQSREALEADGWRYVETLVEMKRATEQLYPEYGETSDAREEIARFLASHLGPNRLVVEGYDAAAHREDIVSKFTGEFIVVRRDAGKRLQGVLLRDGNRIALMAAKGVGSSLVLNFISNAYRDGFDEVFAGTQEINHGALALYGRLGFRTYRRRVTYHKD